MPTVRLGNVSPAVFVAESNETDAGAKVHVDIDNGYDHNNTVTLFGIPPQTPLSEALVTVRAVWDRNHSFDPPEWVESDDEVLEMLLASEFNCAVGMPDDWEGLTP